MKTDVLNRFTLPAIAMSLAAGAMLVQSADWPQYRGPGHNGKSQEKILTQWPAGGLPVTWKVPLTDGFSSFAVAQGKALTLVEREVDGIPTEVCVALDATTGKELWSSPIGIAKYEGGGDDGEKDNRGGDGPRSTPTVDGDAVFVLSASLSLSKHDINTGLVVWKKDLIKEYGGKMITWKNAASPLMDGDLIFVNSTGPSQSLLAFHKKDGSLAWKGQDDKMTHSTPTAATIHGIRQIIFFTQTGLVSVAPQTGKVLWRYKFPYNVSTASSPVVGGDIVYCSAGYGVGAGAVQILKQGEQWTAKELWRQPNKLMSHWSTPVYHNGYLYGIFGFKEYGKAPFKCVELKTGKEMWSQPGFGPGGVLLVDGHVLVLSDRGYLALVEANPKSFKEVARTKAVEGKCWNAPALSNGRIYARSTKEGACLDVSVKMAGQ